MNKAQPYLAGLLTGLVLLGAPEVQARAPDQAIFDGRAKTPDGDRQARLLITCRPEAHDLNLQLLVWDAYPGKQRFDYDAFEGPEPAAGGKKLTLLTASGKAREHELRTDIGGWYSAEVQGAFVFSTNQYAEVRKDLAQLAEILAEGEATLNWVQESHADPRLRIEARFFLDSAGSAQIRKTTARCVAQAKES